MAITNLGLASPNHIEIALSNLKVHYNTRNAWVDPANRYIVDSITRLKADFAAGTVIQQDIKDYIAASILIHCYNSWSYLSNSITAYLEGDFGTSIHNAYYSELRSIMSFLASQGVGVFDGINVIVDAGGSAIASASPYIESKTHVFAKTALDQWLNDAANMDSLLGLISVDNHSLKSWFDATSFPPGSSMPGILAAKWFKDWSLDMDIISGDQKFRNFVSYRPQNFDLNFSRTSDPIRDRLNFVFELWKLCSPDNLFSRSILRNSFEVLYRELFGYSIKTHLNVENDLKPILQGLGMDPSSLRSEYLIKFLRRDVEAADSPLLNYARIKFSDPVIESDTDPIGIISRATLLALLTTNSVDLLLKRTLTSRGDLHFWHENIGVRLGYWAAGAAPYLYSDLWQDIELDIDEIKQWLLKTTVNHSPYTFKNDLKAYSTNIKSLSKTYLWGTTA